MSRDELLTELATNIDDINSILISKNKNRIKIGQIGLQSNILTVLFSQLIKILDEESPVGVAGFK